MDEIRERLGALEAELHAETRNLRAEMALTIAAVRGEVLDLKRRLDHIDECLDRQSAKISAAIKDALEAVGDRIDAAVDFPKRVAWIIVSTIVVGFISALVAIVFSVGKESRRTLHLPTTPPNERSAE